MLSLLFGVLTCGRLINGDGSPVVVSPAGSVRGWESLTRDGRLYQAWTKIPYAQPPVGQLRFSAPKAADEWRGVLNTMDDIPPCLQVGRNTSREDCLYLNVYRPKILNNKMPVVFFIPGHQFQAGNGGTREMAEYMMDKDLVLVAPNARIGGFGFMSLGSQIFPGNYGLKDLVLALRWVKRNIASFGGDPNSVTALGGSSGAISAHLFVNAPVTIDLVTRAHSYSGSINHVTGLLNVDFVRNKTLDVIANVNCSHGVEEDMLLCLQYVNETTLLDAMHLNRAMDAVHYIAFGPVIEPTTAEDAVVTEDLSLRPSTKPWMTTVNSGEYLEFVQFQSGIPEKLDDYRLNLDSRLVQTIEDQVGDTDSEKITEDKVQKLKRIFFPVMDPLQNFSVELAHMRESESVQYPAVYNMMNHRGPKWLAYFEYSGELSGVLDPTTGRPYTDNAPASADEYYFYFNARSSYSYAGPDETQADYDVSKRLLSYLSNFSYHNDPTPLGSTTVWRQFKQQEVFRITGKQDYNGSPMFSYDIEHIYKIWDYIIGWKRT